MGSAITSFQSVVGAQSAGTADIEKMVAAFQGLEGAIDRAGKKGDELNQHKGFGEFAEKIKEGLEHPLQTVASLADDALKSIGPFAAGVAAAAGVAVAAGAAWFEAAKGLGEYGLQIRDVQLRTGLGAKEVGQFGFAARAVGQDVTLLDRLMRGLTQSIKDDSEEGEKARVWLKRFGVDIGDVRNGTAGTAQVLMQVSEGLRELPTQWDRNKAGLDLFKRAGIEALPFLLELTENLKVAQEQGFGPSDGDVARYVAMQREVTILETKLNSFKRLAKEGIVISVEWAGSAIKWLVEHMPGETVNGGLDQAKAEQAKSLAADIASANQMKGRWGNQPLTDVQDLERRRLQALETLSPDEGWAVTYGGGSPWARSRVTEAGQYQQEIEALQRKTIDEAKAERDAETQRQLAAAGAEADRLRTLYFGGKEALEKAYSEAKRDVEKYSQQLANARENKLSMGEVEGIGQSLAAASRRMNTAHAELELQKERVEWTKQAEEFQRSADMAELTAIEKVVYKRDQLLAQAEKLKLSAVETAAVTIAAHTAIQAILQKSIDEFERWDAGATTKGQSQSERAKVMFGANGALNPLNGLDGILKGYESSANADSRIEDINLAVKRSEIGARAGRADRMQQLMLGPGHEAEAAQAGYQIRLGLAQRLYDLDVARAMQSGDADKRRIEMAKAEADLRKETYEAEIERELKIAELQRQRIDQWRSFAVGALHGIESGDLGGFFKQQASGLLDRVTGNVAEMGWKSVSGMIPHASEGSFMGKLLAGSQFGPDPMKTAGVRLETAGDRLTMAAADLTGAARAMATSSTGGGGGFSPVSASMMSSFLRYQQGGGALGPEGVPEGHGLPTDLYGQNGDWAGETAHPAGAFNWGRAAGVGGAALGGFYGLYSGIQSGGGRGALTAAGSTLAAAGSIMALASKALAWAGPAGMIAGAGLSLLAPALFGDPRKEKAEQQERERMARTYRAPAGNDYMVDVDGRPVDYDARGGPRVVNNVTINAMDPQSFGDVMRRNAGEVMNVVAGAVGSGDGEELVGHLQQRVGL